MEIDETRDNLEWAIENAKSAIAHLDDIALDDHLDIVRARNAFIEAIRQVVIIQKEYGGEE